MQPAASGLYVFLDHRFSRALAPANRTQPRARRGTRDVTERPPGWRDLPACLHCMGVVKAI
jgi:hypothetical protein